MDVATHQAAGAAMASMAVSGIPQDTVEKKVGILHFTDPDTKGFSGVLKVRYTDFLVNEINPDGSVLHLSSNEAPTATQLQERAAQLAQNVLSEASSVPEAKEVLSNASANLKENQPPASLADHGVINASSTVAGSSMALKNQDSIATTPLGDSSNDHDISWADKSILVNHFGPEVKEKILDLYQSILAKGDAKPAALKNLGHVVSETIPDRAVRGQIHQDIRRIFASKFESTTIPADNTIMLTPSRGTVPNNCAPTRLPNTQSHNQLKGKLGWNDLGGEFLHFTLHKENKDTMEAITYLAKQLKCNPRDFSFAGTKDRRAVTVQRVSVQRQYAAVLARINIRGSVIGDYKHERHQLSLGELSGNHFCITLKDCRFEGEDGLDDAGRLQLANRIVHHSLDRLCENGFINYFGLQRFGTFGVGTEAVGVLILKGDFEGAISAILNYNEDVLAASSENVLGKAGRDEVARAEAIRNFRRNNNVKSALVILPRKFSAETSVIRHLGYHQNDFLGALLAIPRSLRTMYVHAYQSLVWNMVASERWSRYGSKVIEGDLVLVETNTEQHSEAQDEVDENGEIVVHPAADDASVKKEAIFQRARYLTAEEAQSGKYNIFDVVLPLPGFDVNYPGNDIGDYYKDFMGSDRGGGLDPANMRRSQKDFSLSGSYRKLLARVNNMIHRVQLYKDNEEQLVPTDIDKINEFRPDRPISLYHPSDRNDRAQNGSYSQRRDYSGRGGHGGGRDFYSFTPRQQTNSDHAGSSKSIQTFTNKPAPGKCSSVSDIRLEYTEKKAAWRALPSMLQQEQQEGAQKWWENHLAGKTMENAVDIQEPNIIDTWIPAHIDDQGRRTYGAGLTKIHDSINITQKQESTQLTSKSDSGTPKESSLSAFQLDGTTDQFDGCVESKVKYVYNPDDLPRAGVSVKDFAFEPVVYKTQTFIYLTDGSIKELTQYAQGFSDPGDSPSKKRPSAEISTSPSGNSSQESNKETKVPRVKTSNEPNTTPDIPAVVDSHKIEDTKDVGATAMTDLQDNIDTAQNFSTDIATAEAQRVSEESKKTAVILEFSLGASQYATMALRELMKAGGLMQYKPDFAAGR